MKRKTDQRVEIILYVFIAVVFFLTTVGTGFASERNIRSISIPQRDEDVTMNPGESRQFTHDHLLAFRADEVVLEVNGEDQFISVELDNMENDPEVELEVHTQLTLTLDDNAQEGAEYDVVILFRYSAGDEQTVKQEPYTITVPGFEAVFAANPIRGQIPFEVRFEDRSTGANIRNWFWEFGDGQTSQDQNPNHTYRQHGYYDVSLMVTKGDGEQDTKTRWEYIAAVDPDLDELSYEDPDDLPNFLTLPESNGFADHYYNVRFTPPYPRYQIMEARIGLFDLFGNNGTPDMKVIVWESGEQLGEAGFPGEALDSVIVPYEELHFGNVEPAFNTVDLSHMEIINYGPLDFHIGVEIVADAETDTLAVYVDDGEYVNVSRSLFWSDDEEIWFRMDDEDPSYETPFNFAIHAVVTFMDDVTVLNPSEVPNAILLNPAYPNPFNNSTTVHFDIPIGLPFTSALFDEKGRWIHNIETGFGTGSGSWVLNSVNFPSGTYILRLTTPMETKSTQLIYLR